VAWAALLNLRLDHKEPSLVPFGSNLLAFDMNLYTRERGQDFFLGWEPVVYFRTGLIASPEVEFVSSESDSFFAWKHFDWGFLCAGGCGHRRFRSKGGGMKWAASVVPVALSGRDGKPRKTIGARAFTN
jgi:hypothetical protein